MATAGLKGKRPRTRGACADNNRVPFMRFVLCISFERRSETSACICRAVYTLGWPNASRHNDAIRSRMTSLRRRRHRGYQPIAFPAWRLWEDRRVRTDEGIFGLLYAVRIARVDLDGRVTDAVKTQLVSDLYSDKELPFRGGFKVTPVDAEARWSQGEVELSRTAVLLGVASLDDLLGAAINLLRVMNIDGTASGTVPTGVSDKTKHLKTHGKLRLAEGTCRLYDLCVAIRNSVSHQGSRQKPLAAAWERLDTAEREWWENSAGRSLYLTSPTDEIQMDDRELITVMRVLDRTALEMNEQLATALSEVQWAWLVARELWLINPSQAGNPLRNVGAVQRRARRLWRLDISTAAATEALSDTGLRGDSTSLALVHQPLER